MERLIYQQEDQFSTGKDRNNNSGDSGQKLEGLLHSKGSHQNMKHPP